MAGSSLGRPDGGSKLDDRFLIFAPFFSGPFLGYFLVTTGLFSGRAWMGFVSENKISQLEVLFKLPVTRASQTKARKMVV